MKKVLYAGMLLGVILLTGCSFKQEQVKDDIKKEKSTERIVEVETLPDSFKKEDVPATPLKLTQEQKKEYYKQYEEIILKVNSKYDEDIELGPFKDFKQDEWVTPKDFEQIVIDMATMEFTSRDFGDDSVEDEKSLIFNAKSNLNYLTSSVDGEKIIISNILGDSNNI